MKSGKREGIDLPAEGVLVLAGDKLKEARF